jgi:hypothetical protein
MRPLWFEQKAQEIAAGILQKFTRNALNSLRRRGNFQLPKKDVARQQNNKPSRQRDAGSAGDFSLTAWRRGPRPASRWGVYHRNSIFAVMPSKLIIP